MTARLLFCIAEEAKPFARMASNIEMEGDGPKVFTVVESRGLVVNNRMAELREGGLNETEDFQTDFIGASVQDCQGWVLEKGSPCDNINQNFIGIADERSARDGTLLLLHYEEGFREDKALHFGKFGNLPPHSNTWYQWRIKPEHAWSIVCALGDCGEPDGAFPIYYGSKDEFTDTNGVFDGAEAERFYLSDDRDVNESYIRSWQKDEPVANGDEQAAT